MSSTPTALPAAGDAEPVAAASRPSDFLQLTKPRLTLLVVMTTVAGFLAAPGPYDPVRLVHALAGTWLVAAAAAAFNQVLERRQDAAMSRTRSRPLPAGRMTVMPALGFAVALFTGGTAYLAALANPLTALLGVVTTASYVLLYTPLKRTTPLATLVGAVPGAIPPMMGWSAATGSLGAEPVSLFLILFFWQMPHFLAIALLCRDDYASAGFRVLPVVEPGGRSTARQAAVHAGALVFAALLPFALGVAGRWYALGALALSLSYFAAAWRLLGDPLSTARARALFRFSLLYLPLLLVLMLFAPA